MSLQFSHVGWMWPRDIIFHRANAMLVIIFYGRKNIAQDFNFIFLSFTDGDQSSREVGRLGKDEIVCWNETEDEMWNDDEEKEKRTIKNTML